MMAAVTIEHRHRRAETRHHQQREHLARDRGQRVEHAAQGAVDPAPAGRGQQRQQRAGAAGQQRGDEGHADGVARAFDHARQHVAARGSRCRTSARRSSARTPRRRPGRRAATAAPDRRSRPRPRRRSRPGRASRSRRSARAARASGASPGARSCRCECRVDIEGSFNGAAAAGWRRCRTGRRWSPGSGSRRRTASRRPAPAGCRAASRRRPSAWRCRGS